MITINAPVILLIQRMVFIWNFPLNLLSSHEIRNQYVTEPVLTDNMIGATLQS